MRVVRMKAGAQGGAHEQRGGLGGSGRILTLILAVLCPAGIFTFH